MLPVKQHKETNEYDQLPVVGTRVTDLVRRIRTQQPCLFLLFAHSILIQDQGDIFSINRWIQSADLE